jgi:GTPase
MLVVAPPVNEVVQEHMALCLALRLPFFVVVTKIDLGYNNLQETLSHLENLARLQSCNKKFALQNNNKNTQNSSNMITVFAVSCVTGEGLEGLTTFIRDLTPIESVLLDLNPDVCLFQIDETFRFV